MNEKEQTKPKNRRFLDNCDPVPSNRVLHGRTDSLSLNKKLVIAWIVGALILTPWSIRIDIFAVASFLVLWAAILCCIKLIVEEEES